MQVIPVDHPLWFLRLLLRSFPDIKTLTPIDYRYVWREPNDGRRLIQMSNADFINECVALMSQMKGTGRDVAISSAVIMDDGRICHIPMIDFYGEIPFDQIFSIRK